MATGKIKKLVHLSQQTYLPNTRLVPDHNDKGYGLIEAEDGRDVYFPHEVVEGRRGFDDLRRDQVVEYTLEYGPYLRANLVWLAIAAPHRTPVTRKRITHVCRSKTSSMR
jgi:cold shock CspA family protein